MKEIKEARDFLDRITAQDYLKPNIFREQEEFNLFRRMVEEEKFADLSGRLRGEVKKWDIDLGYAMGEESDEELKIKLQVAEQMGVKSMEYGLDSTFFEKRDACMEWWEQQPYDLKKRCLERVILLLGKEKIDYAATCKYKEIADGISWQNHHALTEACGIIEKLLPSSDAGVNEAEVVVLRFEVDRLNKELSQKKELLKKKNKELRMLRKTNAAIIDQLELKG